MVQPLPEEQMLSWRIISISKISHQRANTSHSCCLRPSLLLCPQLCPGLALPLPELPYCFRGKACHNWFSLLVICLRCFRQSPCFTQVVSEVAQQPARRGGRPGRWLALQTGTYRIH